MKAMLFYIMLATQHNSFTYGFGERSCHGPCIVGVSKTSSGEILSHDVPSAAIPVPRKMRFKPFYLWLKTHNGKCTKIRINDKTSTSLIRKRGFDMSPAAQKALTGKVSRHWSGKIKLCKPPKF